MSKKTKKTAVPRRTDLQVALRAAQFRGRPLDRPRTLEQIAEEAGIGRNWLWHLAIGRAAVQPDLLPKLAKALAISEARLDKLSRAAVAAFGRRAG